MLELIILILAVAVAWLAVSVEKMATNMRRISLDVTTKTDTHYIRIDCVQSPKEGE